VVVSGTVSAGDEIDVSHRPADEITVALMFRALTLEPDLIPSVLAAVGPSVAPLG
jgi:MOSC domain-containing protein YiiM